MSSTGNLSGVTAKFNPFIRTSLSVSLIDLSDRLITHLSVLTLLSVLVELDTLDSIGYQISCADVAYNGER